MGFRLNSLVDTGGVPMYLIKEFIEQVQIDVFVETGTASGGSIKEASKYFNECHTIELNEGRPKYDPSIKNITWHTGNSIDVLPDIVRGLLKHKEENGMQPEDYRYCLWWLDSHFDGDKPKNSPFKDCYLLEELDIISQYAQDSIIIIDDARLFMGYPPHPNEPKEWPTIQQTFAKFKDKFEYYFVTVCDDYIIAFPDRLEWIYQRLWMRDYKKRYPDDDEKIRLATKLVYDSLLKYIQ